MHADLRGILPPIGQSASLIFAAFVFMGFLQQRYNATVDRYRAIVDEYRSERIAGKRRQVIHDEIGLYKRRCELMKRGTNCALAAGMLLTATLVFSIWSSMLPNWSVFRYLGILTVIVGLVMVVVACVYVMLENAILQLVIDRELLDQPDLLAHAQPDRKRNVVAGRSR